MLKLLRHIDKYPKKYLKIQKEVSKKFNKKPLILNNDKEIKGFIKKLK